MPRHLSRTDIPIIADQIAHLAVVLASRRPGSGPHWVAVNDMLDALKQHQVDIDLFDMQLAIAYAVGAGHLKVQGTPPTAVAPIMH